MALAALHGATLTEHFRGTPQSVRLGEVGGDGFHRSWIMYLPEGEFSDPRYGDLHFNRRYLDTLVRHFASGVRGIELALDCDHETGPAPGWIERLEYRSAPQPGLYALIRWTPYGVQLLKEQQYRYFSAEIGTHRDEATGKETKDVPLGGALTNRPVMKSMPSVTLSERTSTKPWGSIKKSMLPRSCFLIPGDPAHKDTWKLPVYEGAGPKDEDGCYTQRGPLNLNGVKAAWAAVHGARTGSPMAVPSSVVARLKAWRTRYKLGGDDTDLAEASDTRAIKLEGMDARQHYHGKGGKFEAGHALERESAGEGRGGGSKGEEEGAGTGKRGAGGSKGKGRAGTHTTEAGNVGIKRSATGARSSKIAQKAGDEATQARTARAKAAATAKAKGEAEAMGAKGAAKGPAAKGEKGPNAAKASGASATKASTARSATARAEKAAAARAEEAKLEGMTQGERVSAKMIDKQLAQHRADLEQINAGKLPSGYKVGQDRSLPLHQRLANAHDYVQRQISNLQVERDNVFSGRQARDDAAVKQLHQAAEKYQKGGLFNHPQDEVHPGEQVSPLKGQGQRAADAFFRASTLHPNATSIDMPGLVRAYGEHQVGAWLTREAHRHPDAIREAAAEANLPTYSASLRNTISHLTAHYTHGHYSAKFSQYEPGALPFAESRRRPATVTRAAAAAVVGDVGEARAHTMKKHTGELLADGRVIPSTAEEQDDEYGYDEGADDVFVLADGGPDEMLADASTPDEEAYADGAGDGEEYADADGDDDGDEGGVDEESNTHGALTVKSHKHGKFAAHSHDGDADHSDAELAMSERRGTQVRSLAEAQRLIEAHERELAEMRYERYATQLSERIRKLTGSMKFAQGAAAREGKIAPSRRFANEVRALLLSEEVMRLSESSRDAIFHALETAYQHGAVRLGQVAVQEADASTPPPPPTKGSRGEAPARRPGNGSGMLALAETWAMERYKMPFGQLEPTIRERLLAEAARTSGYQGAER